MPAKKAGSPSRPSPTEEAVADQDLRALFDGFVSLVDEYAAGIESLLEEKGKSERRALVAIYRNALKKQTSGLRDVLSDAFGAQDPEAQRRARQYLDASGLQGVIAETRELMSSAQSNKRSLWDWIGFILELIKNILLALADLFPKLLSGVFAIIIGIIEILEKIFRMIASFLSERAAVNAETADRIMWSSVENMWNAKAAWQKAHPTLS
jgi:phage-related protein